MTFDEFKEEFKAIAGGRLNSPTYPDNVLKDIAGIAWQAFRRLSVKHPVVKKQIQLNGLDRALERLNGAR